ncbi:MAG: cytochrome c maturation protein CcmE [Anaerolineae bacterium]
MNRRNFIIAGVLIVAAVGYLIVSSTGSSARFFLSIEEVLQMDVEATDRSVTVSGAVVGDSIVYDTSKPRVTFTMVQIPADPKEIEAAGGLAEVLHAAVTNPAATRLDVVYEGVKPDLLKNEAQAIVRGRLQPDGVFYADELLLKCPSRYAEELPEQIED